MSSPDRIRRGYCDCRFGQLHFHEAAPPAPTAPPLVLLHQNPSTAEEYRALIADMARDRHVIAFDTPGYGMSDPPPLPQSIEGYASAVVDGLKALGLTDRGPLDLFGFHTGTLLAIETARLLGEHTGRIALAGIPFRPIHEREARLSQIRAVAPPTDDGTAIFERLRWLWDFIVARRGAGVPIGRAARMFMERAKPLHLYWWAYEGVWTYPIEQRLAAIACPTLILLPDEMLREQSIAAAGLIPDVRTLDLPELTRDIFEPEGGSATLAQALRDFLN